MSLTVCLITRNAEAQMKGVLGSVANLGAEVIVGDTGSTDATVEAARALGAKVIALAWTDDFAAAQNQTLAQATGDWILWLNPDEELLPQGLEHFAALLAHPSALAYVLRVQEIRKADQTGVVAETIAPRLFRRHPEIRFVGRLHPQFAPPLEALAVREGKKLLPCNLMVRRHAYLSVLTPEKLRWANHLLQLELKDRPGQLHYLIEYGGNLLRLNDPSGHAVLAEAAEQVMAAKDAAAAPVFSVASLLEYLLNASQDQARIRIDPAQVGELALRWFPNSPPILWALARRAFDAANYKEAVGLLEKLIRLGRTGTYDRTAAFDPAIISEPPLLNLGICYLRLGDLDRAENCFGQLLTSPSHQAQARHGYASVQALRKKDGGGRD